MKQKIKKVFLWIILIISAVYFVGIFVNLVVYLLLNNIFSFTNLLASVAGLGFFGWIILKLQDKLNVSNLFRKKIIKMGVSLA